MPKLRWPRIAVYIRRMIRNKRLPYGAPLPPVREVAARHGVSPATVARAYRELERSGWVKGRPGAGTFVACHPPRPAPVARQVVRITDLADRFRVRLNPWGMALALARSSGIPNWVEEDAGRKIPEWRRQRLALRFRTSVRAARRAGLTPRETEELFRSALKWETDLPSISVSLNRLNFQSLTGESGVPALPGGEAGRGTVISALLLRGHRPRSHRSRTTKVLEIKTTNRTEPEET